MVEAVEWPVEALPEIEIVEDGVGFQRWKLFGSAQRLKVSLPDKGATVAGDSRYHVLRGELPTGGVNEAYDGTQRQYDGSDYKKRDSKSRFCRKRWWC